MDDEAKQGNPGSAIRERMCATPRRTSFVRTPRRRREYRTRGASVATQSHFGTSSPPNAFGMRIRTWKGPSGDWCSSNERTAGASRSLPTPMSAQKTSLCRGWPASLCRVISGCSSHALTSWMSGDSRGSAVMSPYAAFTFALFAARPSRSMSVL
jgi:hypothetical protein